MAATSATKKEGATTIPTRSGNFTSTAITPVTSIAPTISPAGGAISAATTVTLADSGSNHSIYYTTDGSTPLLLRRCIAGPFSVNAGNHSEDDRHVGPAQTQSSYPSGYGYLPSAVVSASYTTGAGGKQPAAKKSALPATILNAC